MSGVGTHSDPGFVKLGEERIYDGYVIGVVDASFRAPDGTVIHRDVVHHPGAVTVVPVTAAGEVVLVRQFRSAMETTLLEAPAGKRDVAGEPPEITAVRELAEEVGLVAGRLEPLMVLAHSPGFCDERNHLFLATDLTETERAVDGPEEEHMTIVRLPLVEVFDRIADGSIVDAKTVVGLLLAAQRLGVVASRG
ncbi:MAG: NUDIX hydrolase [Microthrixaceae bacterium]